MKYNLAIKNISFDPEAGLKIESVEVQTEGTPEESREAIQFLEKVLASIQEKVEAVQ